MTGLGRSEPIPGPGALQAMADLLPAGRRGGPRLAEPGHPVSRVLDELGVARPPPGDGAQPSAGPRRPGIGSGDRPAGYDELVHAVHLPAFHGHPARTRAISASAPGSAVWLCPAASGTPRPRARVRGRAGRGDRPSGPVRLRRGRPRTHSSAAAAEAVRGAAGRPESAAATLVRPVAAGAPWRAASPASGWSTAASAACAAPHSGGGGALVDGGPDERVPERHHLRVRGNSDRSAASAAAAGTPRACAARLTRPRSPVSSAAATSRNVRVGAGRAAAWR